jgi:hypothetical protein
MITNNYIYYYITKSRSDFFVLSPEIEDRDGHWATTATLYSVDLE